MKTLVAMCAMLIASAAAFGQCTAITGGTQCIGPGFFLTQGTAPPAPTAFQFNLTGTTPLGVKGVATLSTLNGSTLAVDFNGTGYLTIPTLGPAGTFAAGMVPPLPETQITGLATDLANKVGTSSLAKPLGVATLDTNGTLPIGQLPPITESMVASLSSDLGSKVNMTLLGAPNGVATLDVSGKVPLSQLPPISSSIPSTFSCVVNLTFGNGNVSKVTFSECQ